MRTRKVFFRNLLGVDPKWLYCALQALKLPDRGYSRHFQYLRSAQFGIPPVPEQRHIAERVDLLLSDLNAAISALGQSILKLKRYRKAVLKAAVEGELSREWREAHQGAIEPASELLKRIRAERRRRWEESELAKMRAKGIEPTDEKWKGRYSEPCEPSTLEHEVPHGWESATLEQLSTLITSGSRNWSAFYADSGARFIRAQDIKTDKLVWKEVAFVDLAGAVEGTRTRVHGADILITITGANVTKTALVGANPPEAYVSQHVGMVRPVVRDLAEFTYWYVVAPTGGRRVLEGAAYGAGKPGLNLDNLRELVVPLPQKEEQAIICSEINKRLSICESLEVLMAANLRRAARLRQSILEKAFRGELVPQNPNDEPASVLLERIRAQRAAEVGSSGKKVRKARVKEAPAGAGER